MSWAICTIRKVLADAREQSDLPLMADFLGVVSSLVAFIALILLFQEIAR